MVSRESGIERRDAEFSRISASNRAHEHLLPSGGNPNARLNDALEPLCTRLLQQPLVVPHHQVAVDLLHQIEGHAHGDQQARAAVEAGQDVVAIWSDVDTIVGMIATIARKPAPT